MGYRLVPVFKEVRIEDGESVDLNRFQRVIYPKRQEIELNDLLSHFFCTVPKVFPITDVEPKTNSTMKLSKKKIRWIIRQKEKKESSGIIAKIQRITRRRVDQLWKQYRETGAVPVIGETMGRPKKPVTAEESGG